MRLRGSSLAIAGLLALSVDARVAHGQETQGFAELRLSLFPGASGDAVQVVERLRPTFETELGERLKLVATVEAGLRQGRDTTAELQDTLRESALGPLLEAAQCTFVEPDNEFLRVDSAADYLSVDRLYLDLYTGAADVRVGRQALNWGSAQFFNPTDPFPEVLLAEPWRPRRGVNAVRASVPFGEQHDVTAVVAGNDAFTELRAAGRLRLNWLGTDFALVGAYRGDADNGLVGIDIRGTLELGYWLEAAYLIGANPHEELSVGVDYSFPVLERAVLFVQYYRNGAGSTDPSPLSRASELGVGIGALTCAAMTPLSATTRTPDPFAPFVLGRDYLIAGANLVIWPELSGSLALLQNLNDGSGLVVPTVTYNALDWLDVALSAQLPYALGRGGEFKPRRSELQITVPAPDGSALVADLSGLVPDATVTLFSRVNF